MSQNIKTVKTCLQKIFTALRQVKGRDLVLLIGNTGSGKSTMLTSLVFGPDQLEIKSIPKTI